MLTETEIASLKNQGFEWVLLEIAEYRMLCAHAADALEDCPDLDHDHEDLIAQLRKAAE